MGHATHFLGRLERVEPDHVELAMSLYNDSALVRDILGRAKLPEGASRVAVSLDHPEEGPFVLLERSGAFVTCLGRGMRPGDLPVITREKLQRIAGDVRTLRERIEEAKRITGEDERGALQVLYGRVREDAARLTREEVRALRAFLPVLGPRLATLSVDWMDRWREQRGRLNTRQVARRHDEALAEMYEDWGRSTFGAATCTQLALWSAAQHPDAFALKDVGELFASISVLALLLPDPMARARVLNGIGRAGKLVLPGLRETFRRRQELQVNSHALWLGLSAVASAHPKLLTEVGKVFGDATLEHRFRTLIVKGQGLALDAGRLLAWATAGIDDEALGRATHYPLPTDIPEHLVAALAAGLDVNVVEPPSPDSPFSVEYLMTLPVFARAEVEDLYLPRGTFDTRREEPFAERGARLIELMRRSAPGRTVVTEVKPGRNEPCGCGSGKKFKKCCELAA